jgi:hypothetical protein
MNSLRISSSFRILLGILLGAAALLAQFETAEVLGTVRDASGPVLPKASVTLTNQDTSIVLKTTTDANGNYDFFDVKVGRYTIAVEAAGFSRMSTIDVIVNVGARQTRRPGDAGGGYYGNGQGHWSRFGAGH